MGAIESNQHTASGEVAGSFLLGLVESFHRLQILSDGSMQMQAVDVDPEQWHPYEMLLDVLKSIEKTIPAFEEIFFRAGVNFLRIWYERGPGKTMIHSGRDWLYANQYSGGYNTVVRGGPPEEIGWCLLQSIDEEAGIAVYENVSPLASEFIRGVFYGGCILFDDMAYVDVEEVSEPYQPNPAFTRCMITVRFRYKSTDVARNLDEVVSNLRPGASVSLTQEEVECLLWCYKGLLVKGSIDAAYYEGINATLSKAVKTVQEQRDEIEFLSNHDKLTGLPNLRLVQDRLKMSCNRAVREDSRFALLFLDLDGFKNINDTYGHEAGDYVLKAVAMRLSSRVRKVDTVTRLGGDEFLVILTDLTGDSAATHVAGEIIASISKPIAYKDYSLRVGVSIGIAIFPDHGNDPDALLKNADTAMYTIKHSIKNSFAFFRPLSDDPL